jgi:hypothetical protein
MPAARIEPQHMVAVFGGFADPQFADNAAFGKNVLHSKDLLTLPLLRLCRQTSRTFPPKQQAGVLTSLRARRIQMSN